MSVGISTMAGHPYLGEVRGLELIHVSSSKFSFEFMGSCWNRNDALQALI